MFLFLHGNPYETAYLITPDESGEKIQHQYGCVGCAQFIINGKAEAVSEPLASQIEDAMSELCGYGDEDAVVKQIEKLTEWKVERVLGEALIELKDGRFLAVNNCD